VRRVTDAEPVAAGEDWEQQAQHWIAWARKPDFDSYYRYRDDFFAFAPPPGRATLDVGCGEGRVTRDLTARGHRVTSVDAAPSLLAAAWAADPDGTYLHADAARLPFADGSFDVVIGYNTFMDVPDLPGALAESCRVLAPGGRLCVAITHPCLNPSARDTIAAGTYFQTTRYQAWERRDGMSMLFQGWNSPLTAYTRPLEDAGLVIEKLREPSMTRLDGTVTTIPYHLWFRALRPVQSSSGDSS
jgi:SAM-dependent methyltransferase